MSLTKKTETQTQKFFFITDAKTSSQIFWVFKVG